MSCRVKPPSLPHRMLLPQDARLLIQGDLHGVADTGGDGLAGHSTKRSRALIYTGDLGR